MAFKTFHFTAKDLLNLLVSWSAWIYKNLRNQETFGDDNLPKY